MVSFKNPNVLKKISEKFRGPFRAGAEKTISCGSKISSLYISGLCQLIQSFEVRLFTAISYIFGISNCFPKFQISPKHFGIYPGRIATLQPEIPSPASGQKYGVRPFFCQKCIVRMPQIGTPEYSWCSLSEDTREMMIIDLIIKLSNISIAQTKIN